MTTFRTKPVTIEATQWNEPGDHADVSYDPKHKTGSVMSAQGWVTVNPGDWIIAEPLGRGYYPCSPWVFERKYERVEDAPAAAALHDGERRNGFDWALQEIKRGMRVQRAGWNGKGMFVFLVAGSTFAVNRPPLLGIYPEGTRIDYHGHIDMRTAQGQVVPWIASQSDMLDEDWQLYDPA